MKAVLGGRLGGTHYVIRPKFLTSTLVPGFDYCTTCHGQGSIQGIHSPNIEHNCVLDTSPPECYSEHAFIASRATPPSIPTLAHTTLRSCPVTLQCPNQRTGRMYSHCQLERYQRPAQASEISELGWGQPMQAITVEGWRIWKRPAYLRCTPNCEVGAFLRRASLGMMRRCEGSIVC